MLAIDRYKHLLFDLDHTLWDFEANSRATLTELFYEYALDQALGCKLAPMLDEYHKINAYLWGKYNQRKITKEALRDTRFNMLFDEFGYKNPELATTLDEVYIQRCPEKSALMPGA